MEGLKQIYALLERIFPGEPPLHISRIRGMTNVNYLVQLERGKYVVRIPGKGTTDFISRENEYRNGKQMERLGMTPPIIYFDVKSGSKITVFIENKEHYLCGDPGEKEEVIKKILVALKKMHTTPFSLSNRFYIWSELEKYESLVISKRITCLPEYKCVRKQVERWGNFLEIGTSELRVCHNDLVPENLLWTSESEICLIDWEYSGMNDPVWDLASFFQESNLSWEERRECLEFYYDGTVLQEGWIKIEIYEVLADLLWYLWSELVSAAGTDYLAYGRTRLLRATHKIRQINIPENIKKIAK